MPVKVLLNGCGRIGRLAFRIAWAQPGSFQFVHLNDITAIESVAYLIKYDSVHGTFGPDVSVEGSTIVIKDGERVERIPYTNTEKVEAIALADGVTVDMVYECTGVFLTRAKIQPYFDTLGAKKVVVSAPVKDTPAVLNVVMGCNEGLYDAAVDHIVTAASCTTNCLAPVVKVIHEKLGIARGCITTIHNLTNTQTLVDAPNHKKADLRRARSGLMNLAPTSTGSATAIALIFPELKGKLNGLAVRVPLTNASITDCVFDVKRPTTEQEVNAFLKEASQTYLKDILGFDEVPKVSTDYVNDPRSSIVDSACTQVIDGTMVKIYAWYDNEFGYSCRMVDLAKYVADRM
ncbi:Glyceraldehyde-3-phosphate dehydrogenase 3 [Tetrabaena socialis]|uniref:glyceraldehyde-3-phosphate dehydrogenase (NADP(+)) (phosphorylating) n=1 Tax=Tetrabaena socialis TaxID=47790 RepID=A0A2J8AEV2_9CHLO|nr:Glyceraldehyde-3-phosphate dehydrogenase 3 [Tetrabaena socialis]|eukprot:PNH11055.1 Glyceraldehyde-3-phosphate dehydrogenase 3 [Tetrabaena socialis]